MGHTFAKKEKNELNWMDFGIPGEAIGKALGGILGQKKGKKNIKKKDASRKASAGTADPASRDFGRIRTGMMQNPTRPNPSAGDGRAD